MAASTGGQRPKTPTTTGDFSGLIRLVVVVVVVVGGHKLAPTAVVVSSIKKNIHLLVVIVEQLPRLKLPSVWVDEDEIILAQTQASLPDTCVQPAAPVCCAIKAPKLAPNFRR